MYSQGVRDKKMYIGLGVKRGDLKLEANDWVYM